MFENKIRRNFLFNFLLFARFLTCGPSYDRLRKKLTHFYLWKIYHLLFTSGMCYLHYLSLAFPDIPKYPYSNYLLEVTCTFIIRLMLLITMLTLVLTGTKKWEEMLTHILEIEEELSKYLNLSKNLKKPWMFLEYFKMFLLFIVLFIGEAISSPETYGKSLILRGLPLLEANIIIVIIDNIASIVNSDFYLLNEILIQDYIIKKSQKGTPIDINHVLKIYAKLYKTIDLFNELFGWEIVLMYILTVISSLPALEDIISLQLIDKKDFTDMVLAFWRITPCMIITKTCDHAAKKGRRFGTLIYEISNKLPRMSEYELIRDDIKFLREVYSEFKPEFSAAGVFSIDYSVYYALFTLIMSYFAILMQFKYDGN